LKGSEFVDRIAEILALLANPEGVSDTQLADLEHELLALFDTRRSENASLSELESIVTTTEQVRGLAAERLDAAANSTPEPTAEERQAALDQLSARLSAEPEEDEDEDEDEPEVTPAVTAATVPAKPAKRNKLSLSQRAAAAPVIPAAPARNTQLSIIASGDVPGFSAGAEMPDMKSVVKAMSEKYNGIRTGGNDARFNVARFHANYADSEVIDGENLDREVARLMDAVMAGGNALTADGGICAPSEPWYGFEFVSSAKRPVRDSLVKRRVARGGLNWITPPTLASINSTGGSPSQAMGSITEAQDTAGNTDKTYQTIACGTPVEALVDANYLQLEFGNFGARTFPEQTDVWTKLSIAAFARYSETRLLSKIATGSTAVTDDADLGAIRDLTNGIGRLATAYRRRHRMEMDTPLRVILPDWLVQVLANDIRTAMNSEREMLWFVKADVERVLRSVNVNITWHMDGENAAQTFNGVQAAGVAKVFPTQVILYMFHEGAWWYLDNGTLDLGLVRDSTLNTSNNFRTFMEEFWNVGMLGLESLKVTYDICANGLSAGTKDTSSYCGS
jgi:hypothetical protein